MAYENPSPNTAGLTDAPAHTLDDAAFCRSAGRCRFCQSVFAIVVPPPKTPAVLAAEAEQLAWAKATGHRLKLIDRSAAVDIPAALFDTSVSQLLARRSLHRLSHQRRAPMRVGDDTGGHWPGLEPCWQRDPRGYRSIPGPLRRYRLYECAQTGPVRNADGFWVATRITTRYQQSRLTEVLMLAPRPTLVIGTDIAKIAGPTCQRPFVGAARASSAL